MQLMPATARSLGVDGRIRSRTKRCGGTRYLRGLLDRFKRVELAVAAYNAGPKAVARFGGVPPFAETQAYVRAVLAEYRRVCKPATLGPMRIHNVMAASFHDNPRVGSQHPCRAIGRDGPPSAFPGVVYRASRCARSAAATTCVATLGGMDLRRSSASRRSAAVAANGRAMRPPAATFAASARGSRDAMAVDPTVERRVVHGSEPPHRAAIRGERATGREGDLYDWARNRAGPYHHAEVTAA